MEAVAIVSLVGNILQFIDCVGTLVSKSNSLYGSASGTLQEYDHHEMLALHLETMAAKARKSAQNAGGLLENLCSRCCEISDELRQALASFAMKGKQSRTQSLRKALKAYWGREKFLNLETRLAGFRQELTLHVTVDLRSQIDALDVQQSEVYQSLDETTKRSTQSILDALHGNKDHLEAITKVQTSQIKLIHAQTERTILEEIEIVTVHVNEQNKEQRRMTDEELHRSRTDMLSAIEVATSAQSQKVTSEAKYVSEKVGQEGEYIRSHIATNIDVNHAVLSEHIAELQQGLHHIELEMDRKTQELKAILHKLSTTRNETERNRLKVLGNSATVVLVSLEGLYRTLREILRTLMKRANSVLRSLGVKLSVKSSSQVNTIVSANTTSTCSPWKASLSAYHMYYYGPAFGGCGAYMSSSSKSSVRPIFQAVSMVKHIQRLNQAGTAFSDYHLDALARLAIESDQLVWTLSTIVAALGGCVAEEDTFTIMSLAFSIFHDARCILSGKRIIGQNLAKDDLLRSSIPELVQSFYCSDHPEEMLHKPRFGSNSALGRRLALDVGLLHKLAEQSGLPQLSSIGSFKDSIESTKAVLTLTLLGLLQTRGRFTIAYFDPEGCCQLLPKVLFQSGCLYVSGNQDNPAKLFIRCLCSAGFAMKSSYNAHPDTPAYLMIYMQQLSESERQAWYYSREYAQVEDYDTWWPTERNYRSWRRIRDDHSRTTAPAIDLLEFPNPDRRGEEIEALSQSALKITQDFDYPTSSGTEVTMKISPPLG